VIATAKAGRKRAPRRPSEADRIRARFQELVRLGRFSDGKPKTFRELNNRGAREAMAKKEGLLT
jgi:hypothetical protein